MKQTEFLALIDQHQGILHKVCRLYRDTREDQEDLFQEIIYQLWRSLPSFVGTAKFTTWMYRIALNTAMATYRKKTPRLVFTDSFPERDNEDWNAEQQQREERMFAALKQLNDPEKALIALYLDDLSYREIAELTGLTESHVGVKLNRIKTKIKKLLNIN
ncbi:RNA polymerase sigma factor [Persicitalea sp.]|uniref:RNA polymerase sigma factor n=1 Tax=Persicitalea sp. TaxID=3100273 RepID=UPI00359344BC